MAYECVKTAETSSSLFRYGARGLPTSFAKALFSNTTTRTWSGRLAVGVRDGETDGDEAADGKGAADGEGAAAGGAGLVQAAAVSSSPRVAVSHLQARTVTTIGHYHPDCQPRRLQHHFRLHF